MARDDDTEEKDKEDKYSIEKIFANPAVGFVAVTLILFDSFSRGDYFFVGFCVLIGFLYFVELRWRSSYPDEKETNRFTGFSFIITLSVAFLIIFYFLNALGNAGAR